jgi:hypothetical protein
MKYFLWKNDYNAAIRQEKLNEILDNDDNIRLQCEMQSQGEVSAYLRQRYDVSVTFAGMTDFDAATVYAAGDRVLFAAEGEPEKAIYYALLATTAGQSPTTTPASWTKGDNRDSVMVGVVRNVTLYHLHGRINPRQIPQHRITLYEQAIDWLKAAAAGDIEVDLPLKLNDAGEETGNRIRWGSQTKETLSY